MLLNGTQWQPPLSKTTVCLCMFGLTCFGQFPYCRVLITAIQSISHSKMCVNPSPKKSKSYMTEHDSSPNACTVWLVVIQEQRWVRDHVDLSSLLQGWRMRVDPSSQHKDAPNNPSKQRPGRMNQGPVQPMVVIVSTAAQSLWALLSVPLSAQDNQDILKHLQKPPLLVQRRKGDQWEDIRQLLTISRVTDCFCVGLSDSTTASLTQSGYRIRSQMIK